MSNEEKLIINKAIKEFKKIAGIFIQEKDYCVKYVSLKDILKITNKMFKELKEK